MGSSAQQCPPGSGRPFPEIGEAQPPRDLSGIEADTIVGDPERQPIVSTVDLYCYPVCVGVSEGVAQRLANKLRRIVDDVLRKGVE